MSFRIASTATLLAFLGSLLPAPAQAVPRAFVASYGDNANTSYNCDLDHPCRQFFAAVTVVDQNGEVVALDTAGYGLVTLAQSISLTAAPGAYAGISVFPGNAGVTIASAGISVTLRGLTINSLGGDYGINMTNGAKLSIENCVISNFSLQAGVSVSTRATVRIVNSLIRDNLNGAVISGGAKASISGSQFLGNSNVGIFVYGGIAGTTSTAAISETVMSGGSVGITAFVPNGTSTAKASVIRSAMTNNSLSGVIAQADLVGGTATITLSDSMVTGNGVGLTNSGLGGKAVYSLGNNTVSDNGAPASGPVTVLPPM